jgi:hypothetical protein
LSRRIGLIAQVTSPHYRIDVKYRTVVDAFEGADPGLNLEVDLLACLVDTLRESLLSTARLPRFPGGGRVMSM